MFKKKDTEDDSQELSLIEDEEGLKKTESIGKDWYKDLVDKE